MWIHTSTSGDDVFFKKQVQVFECFIEGMLKSTGWSLDSSVSPEVMLSSNLARLKENVGIFAAEGSRRRIQIQNWLRVMFWNELYNQILEIKSHELSFC